jgi:hypothetical protein
MLTFTLPESFRRLARSHQLVAYNLLFRASAAATKKLAQDPRFKGGKIGMLGILPTWGTLIGLSSACALPGTCGWHRSGWGVAANPEELFIPTKALAKIVRAKFRDGLRKAECFDELPA